ncbi:fumarylacetoacetate hydrolase family protein [Amycolatopsis sp. NPDC048633]|uniref:fumarylacetoacetate hydrolase family protein n=1 Tax=Amycolatopsis sp. NPDC048633 TaxID=3157095 RepID=UPI0033D55EBC
MKLTTIRAGTGTRAARVEPDGTLVELASPDVGALISLPEWRTVASASGGARHEAMLSVRAPIIPRPGKIIRVDFGPCLAAASIEGRGPLVGSKDDVVLAQGSVAAGWNARLAVVIGSRLRSTARVDAEAAIAGFSLLTDVNAHVPHGCDPEAPRRQSSSFGPTLVTPDDLPGGLRPQLSLRAHIEGHLVREANVAAVTFDPVAAVRHVSQLVHLEPGDVIALAACSEAWRHGSPTQSDNNSVLEVELDGIGFQENAIRLRSALVPAARHPSRSS